MKKLVLAVLLSTLASPAWATTYYLGQRLLAAAIPTMAHLRSPWLTPKHSVNCGDVILAAAGTYAEGNFRPGQWGTVTCTARNNVAWLKCATFDTCKIIIRVAGHDAMTPTQSYWGIQG